MTDDNKPVCQRSAEVVTSKEAVKRHTRGRERAYKDRSTRMWSPSFPNISLFTIVLVMVTRLKPWFLDRLARNFSLPENSIFGWLAVGRMLKNNSFLETNAVKLCNIKPDHNVLEIGFGPGVGLEAAYNIVKDGKGKVHGIDTSFEMVNYSGKKLRKAMEDKKVVLFHGSANNIPLNTDSIDRVFHCNCYYFWPNMRTVMREIYRVMIPGAVMITTLNIKDLEKAQNIGILKYGRPDPVKYMSSLEKYGFENVRMEYKKDEDTGKEFQVIFAEVTEKPAHDKPMLSDDEDDALEREELRRMIQAEKEAQYRDEKK